MDVDDDDSGIKKQSGAGTEHLGIPSAHADKHLEHICQSQKED